MNRPPSLLSALTYLLPTTCYLLLCYAPTSPEPNPQASALPHAIWSEDAGISRAPVLAADGSGNSFLLTPVLEPKNPGKKAWLLQYSLPSNSLAPGLGSGRTGTSLPPTTNPSLLWRFPALLWNLPALADLNGDSLPEVFLATLDGRLVCLSAGNPTWEITGLGPSYSSPALSDLDGDGKLDLVTAGRNRFVHCLDAASGRTKWRFLTSGEVDSSPAIADLLGDSKLEVVIGSDDGFVYCLSGEQGKLLWRFRANWWVTASPTVADLEGNGSREVLVGDTTGTLYCLAGATGELLWSYPTPQPIVSEATAADLDGDGRKEVFFGSDALYCLDWSGSLLWKFAPGEHFSATPLLLAGAKGGWVVIPGDNLYCLDSTTGKPIWQRSLSPKGLFDASVALDGQRNLLLALSTGSGQIVLLCSPGPSGVTSLPWPKPRANLLNTGFAP